MLTRFKPMKHQINHGQVEHSFATGRQRLVVLAQPTILAGDDPEGVQMYTRTFRKAKKYVDTGDILFVVGNNDCLVNSIQKFSSVVIQKSTKEGFCLSVTEALWKGTPVVASNVGGIPAQIVDGESGYLLDPYDIEGFADRIVHILKNADEPKGQ